MIEQRNAVIEEKTQQLQQFGELLEGTKKLIEDRGSKVMRKRSGSALFFFGGDERRGAGTKVILCCCEEEE